MAVPALRCSGTFVTHTLAHTTTVPGRVVRLFDSYVVPWERLEAIEVHSAGQPEIMIRPTHGNLQPTG